MYCRNIIFKFVFIGTVKPFPFHAEDKGILNLIKVILRITYMSLSFSVEIIMLNYNVFHKPLVLTNTCEVNYVKNITTLTFILLFQK